MTQPFDNRDADVERIFRLEAEAVDLRRRIMDLEGCLVHVRNYLPTSLKAHVEEVLWPK